MQIFAASAIAPTLSHIRAMEKIAEHAVDPVAGPISIAEAQLCPQHSGVITEALVEHLMQSYPQTKFRLHATPRVKGEHSHAIVYASNADTHRLQMGMTAKLSRQMKAPGYSIHAGIREQSTLRKAFDNVKRLADLFECRVGIEGLYPPSSRENFWLMSTWAEYAEAMTSGIDYALDLSHLHIVSKRERRIEHSLVQELIEAPNCMEIHISDNNGRADSHRPMTVGEEPWWWTILAGAKVEAPVFYEGSLYMPKKGRPKG